jgi:hypothetical protein
LRGRVWFHRISAAFWGLLGAISFLFDWQNSVAMVWLASVYANVKSDIGAAEAADDSAVIQRLEHHQQMLQEQRQMLTEILERLRRAEA